MPKFRGFIAIDIKVNPKMLQLKNEIKNSGADVKLVESENFHLTLKFLGDTDDQLVDQIETIISEASKDINPFSLKLKGTGVFPNENYIKVIWIGVENGEVIASIANIIDEQLSKLGFTKEKRKFSSHLTIGRVKTARNKEKLLQIISKYADVDFTEVKVDSIKLKQSELTPKGPIYSTIKEVKL